MGLVAKERESPPTPVWKAFFLLNRRMPSLRLVVRVNNLIKRACDRLQEVGESGLERLARQQEQGNAQRLLRDVESLRKDLRVAKAIDWKQHERTLAQFSRTRSVELACNQTAPIGVLCYTRALELLLADECRYRPLRKNSQPLIQWIARIEHPEAKSLLAFDDVMAWVVEQEVNSRAKKALRKSEAQRERTKRHREWYRGKWVYPGDWLRLRDAADFSTFWGREHPMPTHCSGLEDSEDRDRILKYDPIKVDLSCGCRLADGFYYHRTRHVARCRDCQEAEWSAQGFEVVNGYPYGDWQATTAERLAEQKRRAQEQLERDRRWLQTHEGQQWLREANRRFEELQRADKARKRR
jgi:hypothetical protein